MPYTQPTQPETLTSLLEKHAYRAQVLQQAQRQTDPTNKQHHNAAPAVPRKPFARGHPMTERFQCNTANVGEERACASKGTKKQQDEAALGDDSTRAAGNGTGKGFVAVVFQNMRCPNKQAGGERVGYGDKQSEGYAGKDAGA